MIDLKRTLNLIKGGMFDPEQTWRSYVTEAEDWQKTAFLLTGPLIILSAVAAYIFGFVGSDVSLFGGFRPTIVSTLMTLVTSVIAAAVVAFVVSALAGAFGGKSSFALGLAATTFAFMPGYVGQAVTWLPWIGGLLALGLFIYSLVLLWKVIPIYLSVPDGKRVGHYILSLVVTLAAMIVLSITVNRMMGPSMGGPSFESLSERSLPRSEQSMPRAERSVPGTPARTGIVGSLARQGELMQAAEEDTFNPPSNGRLSEGQVREFIRVMQRTEELQQEKMDRLKALSEKAESDQEISLSDFGGMMSGMTEVAGLQTSEIEVVKTAGGNWAEHQWVQGVVANGMAAKRHQRHGCAQLRALPGV